VRMLPELARVVLLCCRVELRTQEAERGMNSEEAERLVWAAQEIFANGCAHLFPFAPDLCPVHHIRFLRLRLLSSPPCGGRGQAKGPARTPGAALQGGLLACGRIDS
jgi:hypothetical protein